MSENSTEKKLWLWRNGDHFWAFESLTPYYANGDPMTLGEPIGYALLKSSFSVAVKEQE